ncbi:MAG: TRAP transporter large permease subunit [Chloroflexi bacterium]|nr:TRAP transporter large permease subunit [Chloroflexota bacterium]
MWIIALMFGLLIAGVLAGLNVGFVVGLAGIIGVWLVWQGNLDLIGQIVWNTFTNYSFIALILFVLMGEIGARSGLSRRMYDTISLWLGRLPGGLIHVNIISCGLFAAVSGSTVATALTVGAIAYPQQKARGYDARRCLASIASGGTLGILIPPSIMMIIYALLTETSLGRLYLAGFLPGLMIITLFIGYVFISHVWHPQRLLGVEKSIGWHERLTSLVSLVPITILLGGMLIALYFGLATATELAAVGVLLVCVLGWLYRELSWKSVKEAMTSTLLTSSMTLFLILGGTIVSRVAVNLRLGNYISEVVAGWGLNWLGFFAIVVLVYLILGCLIDAFSILVITVPVMAPALFSLGVDPVWLGIVLTLLIEIAVITPPFGINLFVIDSMAGGGYLPEIIKGCIPYVLLLLFGVGLLTLFPQIALLLPNIAYGR